MRCPQFLRDSIYWQSIELSYLSIAGWLSVNNFCYTSIEKLFIVIMSDLDRGIMKFKGADTPVAIAISSAIVLGGILFLIIWAMQNAYAV